MAGNGDSDHSMRKLAQPPTAKPIGSPVLPERNVVRIIFSTDQKIRIETSNQQPRGKFARDLLHLVGNAIGFRSVQKCRASETQAIYGAGTICHLCGLNFPAAYCVSWFVALSEAVIPASF